MKTKSTIKFEHNKKIISWDFAFIALATLAIGIAIAAGAPLSPWWLLAPIASPFVLVTAGVAFIVATALLIGLAGIVGTIIAAALIVICGVPAVLALLVFKFLTITL